MNKKIIGFATIMIMAAVLSACGKRDPADSKNKESVRTTEKVKVTETHVSKDIVANVAKTVSDEAINITEEAIAVTNGALADIEELQAEQTEESNIIVEEKDSASEYFTPYPISDAIFSRIYGLSYKENCKVSLDELRYIRVLHYNFNGEVVDGELIVNQKIAQDVCEVFRELYEVRYPIEKIRLVDEYQADDNLSMADNNSSAFNYRVIDGTNRLSNHAKGFAIDINPLYNPYVKIKDGVQQVLPDNAYAYADRNASNPYYIQRGDICYQIFTSHGFAWGGDWVNSKDYQHFEKTE